MHRRGCYFTLVVIAALFGCSSGESPESSDAARESRPLSVFAVAYPLQYFAERIAGDLADVRFPAPAAVDPAAWSPEPEIVAAYQRADLILRNGAGYAAWVGRASLPRSRLVDTAAAFQERFIPLDGSVTHTHGPGGAHVHAGVAFTTWLDPQLAAQQARAVAEALARARPPHREEFLRAHEELASDLRELDERLAAAADSLAGAPLLFSHPVYQYFTRRYGLNARSLHWEPGEVPTPGMWRELAELLAEHPARAMLWEAAPLETSAAQLRALGVASAVYAPCGNVPEDGDFLDVMRANAAAFEALGVNRKGGSRVERGGQTAEE
jgi:zinc transport system substrate-binding protein